MAESYCAMSRASSSAEADDAWESEDDEELVGDEQAATAASGRAKATRRVSARGIQGGVAATPEVDWLCMVQRMARSGYPEAVRSLMTTNENVTIALP
jgi:hypothetical protein